MTRTRDGLHVREALIRRQQIRNNILMTNPRLSFDQAEEQTGWARQFGENIWVSTLDRCHEMFGLEYPVHDGVAI